MIDNTIHFIKSEDKVRKYMTAYTRTGVLQVITDSPYFSMIVEYNNKGGVVVIDTECDINVKEYDETGNISNSHN